jgi:hypothetical protein
MQPAGVYQRCSDLPRKILACYRIRTSRRIGPASTRSRAELGERASALALGFAQERNGTGTPVPAHYTGGPLRMVTFGDTFNQTLRERGDNVLLDRMYFSA